MRIYLLRHAETEVVDGDYYGAGLSSDGVMATFDLLQSGLMEAPDVIDASPFRRARETAAVFADAYELPAMTAEWLGEWQLQTQNLDAAAYAVEEAQGWANFDRVVAGGESLNDLIERGLAGLSAFAGSTRCDNALLVSHGTIIDLIAAQLSGREPRIEDIRTMPYLAYAVIDVRDGVLTLIKDVVGGMRRPYLPAPPPTPSREKESWEDV